jgi:multiple antibiotic resistance protein
VMGFVMALMTLFCPPVAMPMYASVTGHFPASIQRQVALRLFAWIGALMVGAAWGGQFVLRIFGLTLGALTLTGGLVLCLWSIPMMRGAMGGDGHRQALRLEYAQWRSFIAVPLIFPLSIGSAVISLVISTATRFNTFGDLCLISVLCVLHAAAISLVYACSGLWCNRLGAASRIVVERLSGIVLTAIAFQMLAQGVRELLPGLAS